MRRGACLRFCLYIGRDTCDSFFILKGGSVYIYIIFIYKSFFIVNKKAYRSIYSDRKIKTSDIFSNTLFNTTCYGGSL